MQLGFRNLFVWAVGASLALVFAQAAVAQEYSLGEVVVSGKKQPVSEKAATVREVTAQDIEKSGARTLDEAIALLPGVYIRTANDGAPRVDIRGMRTRQVVFLLNGVPLNSTYDGQFDPSFVTVEQIARIKVTYGASSVLYGAGGNAAVINVITKGGSAEPQATVGARFGDGDSRLYSAQVSADKGTVALNASGSMYDRSYTNLSGDFDAVDKEMQDSGQRRNSDRTQRNAAVSVTIRPEDATQMGVFLSMHQGEYGKPNATKRDFYVSNNITNVDRFKFERMDDSQGFNAHLGASHEFDIPLTARGWLFANSLDEEENGYDNWNYNSQFQVRNAYKSKTKTDRLGGAMQLGYDLDSLGRVTGSLSGERQQWQNAYTTRPDDVARRVTTTLDKHVSEFSGGLEYEVNPLDDLGLVAGIGTHSQHRQDSDDKSGESYMAGAYYDLFSQTRLRANWAQKLRFPSISQLYDPTKGVDTLNPERTTHYEAGIDQGIECADTEVGLSVFRTETKGFIEKSDVTGLNENHEDYVFKGVEATVVNNWFDGLTLSGALTYLESRNESDRALFTELQYRPQRKASLAADYVFPAEWITDLRAHGSWLYVDKSYIFTKDGLTEGTINGYTVVDFKVEKGFFENTLKTYVGADNLLDENYEESYALPRPGRSFYAGVSYSF